MFVHDVMREWSSKWKPTWERLITSYSHWNDAYIIDFHILSLQELVSNTYRISSYYIIILYCYISADFWLEHGGICPQCEHCFMHPCTVITVRFLSYSHYGRFFFWITSKPCWISLNVIRSFWKIAALGRWRSISVTRVNMWKPSEQCSQFLKTMTVN